MFNANTVAGMAAMTAIDVEHRGAPTYNELQNKPENLLPAPLDGIRRPRTACQHLLEGYEARDAHREKGSFFFLATNWTGSLNSGRTHRPTT